MSKEKQKNKLSPMDSFTNSEIPKYYFNGFTNGFGPADMCIVLQCNGEDLCKINGSYTSMKTLSEKLNLMVTTFEKTVGVTVGTIDEFSDKMFPESHHEKK